MTRSAALNVEKIHETFDRDGFAVISGALDERALAELRAGVDRYITQVAPTFPPDSEWAMYLDAERPESLIRMNKMHDHDEFFRTFPIGAPWKGLAERLSGEPVTLRNVVYFNKPPRSVASDHPSPPHQDNYYYHFDPPSMMSFWMPLEPIDAQTGCLRYVAGSHRRGIRKHAMSSTYGFSQGICDYGPDDWANERRPMVEPGDAIAHHCMTIHRADANESDTRSRVAMVFIYEGDSAKIDEAWRARHIENVRKQQAAVGRKPTI